MDDKYYYGAIAIILAVCEKWKDWRKDDTERKADSLAARRWRLGGRLAVIFGICILAVHASNESTNAEKRQAADSVRIATLQHSVDSSNNKLTDVATILDDVYKLQLKDSGGMVVITNNTYSVNYQNRSTTVCQIEVELASKPNGKMQTLCNGDRIPLQYILSKDHKSFIIPYMRGKDFASGFDMYGLRVKMFFDKSTGTFQCLPENLPEGVDTGTKMTFSASIPIR